MSGCAQTSVSGWESCGCGPLGLAGYGADPNDSAIKAAVAQSTPPGAPSGYATVCEAQLRAGGLCYWKSSPGDCGAPAAIPGITSGQIAGLSGAASSGVIGGLGVAGVIGGAATLGISTAVSVAVAGIEGVFAHHDQAVANEQATICAVMNYFNPAKKAIDNAVRSGAISSDEGVTYLTQIANQAKNGLSGIMQKCNAACVYQGVLQAFINYSRTWYDYIAPTNMVMPQAPGGPPTTYGTPPGGVTTAPASPAPPPPIRSLPSNTYAPAGPSPVNTTAPVLQSNANLPSGSPSLPASSPSDYLNLGYRQQTGQSVQAADVPNTFVFQPWMLILGGILIFLLLMRS